MKATWWVPCWKRLKLKVKVWCFCFWQLWQIGGTFLGGMIPDKLHLIKKEKKWDFQKGKTLPKPHYTRQCHIQHTGQSEQLIQIWVSTFIFNPAGITYSQHLSLSSSDENLMSSQSPKLSSRLRSDCPQWSRYSGIFCCKDRCFRGSEGILAPQRSFSRDGIVTAVRIWPHEPINLIERGIWAKQATTSVNINRGFKIEGHPGIK